MELSRGFKRLLVVAAIAYSVWLGWYHCPYAGGSDSSGYLNSAKLLLAGRLTAAPAAAELLPTGTLPVSQFAPLGFTPVATTGRLAPTYPLGLPVHYAAAGFVVGIEHAATLVSLLAALAFPLLLYFTAREFGVRPDWSAGVAVLGALAPLTIYYALQPMSDLVAADWILVTILGALRASRHAGWAAVAGAALAVAVLVRPTSLLLLLPAALALPARGRAWLAFLLGGLPGALLLALYNRALYGSALATGYGRVRDLLGTEFILPTLQHYAVWVPVVATPLVLAALGLPWLPLEGRKKIILLAWAGGLFLFYAAYFCTHETWWYLRFVLPALPAVGIAAALALQQIRFPSWQIAAQQTPADNAPAARTGGLSLKISPPPVLLLLAAVWLLAWDRQLHINQIELEERPYRETGRWIAAQLPPGAIVAAHQMSGAVMFYAGTPLVRSDAFTPELYARLNAALAGRAAPFYAVLFAHEEADAFTRMPGRWKPVVRFRNATVWRRTGLNPSP